MTNGSYLPLIVLSLYFSLVLPLEMLFNVAVRAYVLLPDSKAYELPQMENSMVEREVDWEVFYNCVKTPAMVFLYTQLYSGYGRMSCHVLACLETLNCTPGSVTVVVFALRPLKRMQRQESSGSTELPGQMTIDLYLVLSCDEQMKICDVTAPPPSSISLLPYTSLPPQNRWRVYFTLRACYVGMCVYAVSMCFFSSRGNGLQFLALPYYIIYQSHSFPYIMLSLEVKRGHYSLVYL